ncbi:hypothetical protein [Caballeronia sp.]|nr:hypothetical protein [Caballeronia sp.]
MNATLQLLKGSGQGLRIHMSIGEQETAYIRVRSGKLPDGID